MKIVWISHSQKLGGAERSLAESVRGLVGQGHELVVVLPSDGDLGPVLRAAGAQTLCVPSYWWVHEANTHLTPLARLRKGLSSLRSALRLRSCLRRERPDLVVTNTITVPTGALAARLAGVPHFWYLHEFGRKDHGLVFDWGERRSLRAINRLSSRILVNSQALGEHFAHSLPRPKLRLVHYAVETFMATSASKQEAKPTRDGALQLLLMGQIAPGKRQSDAVRAVAHLVEKGLDVRLTLLGSEHDANYSASLRALVEELGLGERVVFRAFTPEPMAALAAADVVLMCSQNEAFGRVTVEAMKLGKAVVGANSGGTTELIQDGVNGLLYAAGDARDLADKIERLLHDPSLIEELGRNAREWSHSTFNLARHTQALLRVFEEVHRDGRKRST